MSVAIYALRDPRDGRARYIGKANDPAVRLKTHLEENSRRKSHKACWIRSLKKLGLRPVVEVLEWVPASEWQAAERAWIEYGLWSRWPLTNGTLGGDGGYVPNSWSPEARVKRQETFARNGTLLNGQRAMAEARRGKGRPVGSGSKPGVPTKVGSRVESSKLTEADVLDIRKRLVDGYTGVQVAAIYDVTSATISLIRTGRAWKHV